jgi:hypothetical protein
MAMTLSAPKTLAQTNPPAASRRSGVEPTSTVAAAGPSRTTVPSPADATQTEPPATVTPTGSTNGVWLAGGEPDGEADEGTLGVAAGAAVQPAMVRATAAGSQRGDPDTD